VNGWSTAVSLSFRTKVFLLVAGAALLIVAPALFLIAHAVEGRVYERAVEELDRASEVLALNWALQDTVLLGEVRGTGARCPPDGAPPGERRGGDRTRARPHPV
jgi:hypothetical protein